MMFFELKSKVKRLTVLQKVWMYPTAHILSSTAKAVLWATDKFNAATFRAMIKH